MKMRGRMWSASWTSAPHFHACLWTLLGLTKQQVAWTTTNKLGAQWGKCMYHLAKLVRLWLKCSFFLWPWRWSVEVKDEVTLSRTSLLVLWNYCQMMNTIRPNPFFEIEFSVILFSVNAYHFYNSVQINFHPLAVKFIIMFYAFRVKTFILYLNGAYTD